MRGAEHTPGPWMFSEDGCALYGSDHGVMHDVHGEGKTCLEIGHSPAECGPPIFALASTVPEANEYAENDVFVVPRQADRRLIVAAPLLLEALKAAKHMLERDRIDPAKYAVIEKCELAIAEATGGAA